MKKMILFLMGSILMCSANAQNTTSRLGWDSNNSFAITADLNTAVTTTPKNPDAPAVQVLNATATCFCVISYNDLTDQQSRSGVCMDITNIVNTTYSGVFPEKDDNRKDCQKKCSDAAYNLSAAQKQAIADCACAAGVGNGTPIRAYSAVGVKRYQSDQAMGTLVNIPAVVQTTCKCPVGWWSNTSNVDGGVTADGKCKKPVCGPIGVTPPANGTPVGTWGFTWGNALYAWGTAANGGAATCKTIVVSPAQCKLQ